MPDKCKLAIIQCAFKGDAESMYAFLENEISRSKQQGADLVCLQELCMGPYFCQSIDESSFEAAENIDKGIYFGKFKKLAQALKIFLIYPFFEKKIKGLYFNSVATFDPEGNVLHIYRKTHIPDDPCFFEKFYFSPGETMNPVVETPFGKIATLICWDQWFPENARIAALMGANIILYPTAIGIIQGEEIHKEKFINAWKTVQISHAITNGCFVASVNRIGVENHLHFWGHSFVCDPYGQMLSDLKESESLHVLDIDVSKIEAVRHTWPFFRDRRTDLYKGILKKDLI